MASRSMAEAAAKCFARDRSMLPTPIALVLSLFICMLLAPPAALAQKVTTLELRRELGQLDRDIQVLQARASSLKDLSSRLSTATKRLSEANIEPLSASFVKLRDDCQKYMTAYEAGSGQGPAKGSAGTDKRAEIDRTWNNVVASAASAATELDRFAAAFSQVSDLARPLPYSSPDAGMGFVAELQDSILREIAPLNQARFETRQYDRDAQTFDNFRKNTIPSMIEQLPSLKAKLGQTLTAFVARVTTETTSTNQALKTKEERQQVLVKELGQREEGQQRTDTALLTYALPSFGVLLIALLMIPKLYSPASQRSIFYSGLLLELITVFLLTTSILLLGIAEKLNSEVLGTLIGGISGYVLGRWRQNEAPDKAKATGQQVETEGDAA